jgi:hypothetical protein
MTMILEPQNTKIGQLSCNFQSSILAGSTLAEYVLQKGVSVQGRIYNKLEPKETALSKFRNIRETVYNEHLEKAVENIELGDSYRFLNKSSAREIQLRKLQEESILNIYIECFDDLDRNLTF